MDNFSIERWINQNKTTDCSNMNEEKIPVAAVEKILHTIVARLSESFEFVPRDNEFGGSTFELRQAVNNYGGVFPAQLRESGVMFYDGATITIEQFKMECKRQGYTFKVK